MPSYRYRQSMSRVLQHLKPTDAEIRRLALDETDPSRADHYEPIARGPAFALLALSVVLVLAMPSCLLRLVRGVLRARREGA
jgi:hypothetical protein